MPTILLLLLFVGMWALLILPQQRKAKAHKALVRKAGVGDRILMASGVYGTITEVLDVALYVEIAEGIEILVNRSQVQDILEEFPTEPPALDASIDTTDEG
jgi:preprotein translocase subunit YajC